MGKLCNSGGAWGRRRRCYEYPLSGTAGWRIRGPAGRTAPSGADDEWAIGLHNMIHIAQDVCRNIIYSRYENKNFGYPALGPDYGQPR